MTASQEAKLNADVAIRFGVVKLVVHAQARYIQLRGVGDVWRHAPPKIA